MATLLEDFYRGKRVFVTGHTGFKGSWMCKMLANAGAIITGYYLAPNTNPSLFDIAVLDKDIHSVIGDIRDYAALKKAFGYNKVALWRHYQIFGKVERRFVEWLEEEDEE